MPVRARMREPRSLCRWEPRLHACARASVRIVATAALITCLLVPTAAGANPSFTAGREAYLSGRHLDAINAFRVHLTGRPRDAAAWVWLGASYYHLGHGREAAQSFERAHDLQPSGEVALWLGAAYTQVGNDVEARRAFVRASHSPRPQTARVAAQWLRAASGRSAPVLHDEAGADAYARIVRWYNPVLAAAQVDAIVRSVLYYSMLYRVDPRLVMALIAVESGFRIHVQSHAGAYGLGQLMPATWQALGVNPADPVANIYGTVQVLRANLDQFGSNHALALAAYNAGRGAVTRYGGIPPFNETQWYVVNVMDLYRHLVGG
jgi:tetratricopeptide (TPR) repeat protein